MFNAEAVLAPSSRVAGNGVLHGRRLKPNATLWCAFVREFEQFQLLAFEIRRSLDGN
ncbi:hypothetical protein [Streptomyces sp. NPDC048419]|uniref:hypothetical protein n=1 Tax=Streptomyces sp. NPDC048419 TaxID=3365547 RepID=UPI0037191AC5